MVNLQVVHVAKGKLGTAVLSFSSAALLRMFDIVKFICCDIQHSNAEGNTARIYTHNQDADKPEVIQLTFMRSHALCMPLIETEKNFASANQSHYFILF